MRAWTIAMVWAAVTAAVLAWFDPESLSLAGFLGTTATLTPPIWLAVQLEERSGGCLVKGIWS